MNAFANYVNTTTNNTTSTGYLSPFNVGIEAKIIYPENDQNIDSTNFNLVRFVAESYSNQLGVSLVFRLTGYTDRNNYRFESSQFPFNGEWRRLVIAMNRGILNVISD